MKKDVLNNVSILLILLLSLSLVANANVGNKNSAQHELQVLEKVVLDKEMSLYQFALTHQLILDDLMMLNPTLTKNQLLKVGQTINLPKNAHKTMSPVSEQSALPQLGNSIVASDNELASLIEANVVNLVPGNELIKGTNEEKIANAAVLAANEEWKNLNSQQLLDDIKNQAENKAVNTVVGQVNQEINAQASNFLGQFGKAEVNITLDKEGKLSNYELQVLSPIYDKDESLIFSQVGIHEQGVSENARLIGNFGLGYRYETNDWLAGANAFIDHDFTGSNTRLGLGTEFWADNYKLAANTYMPLSNWKESEVMKHYEALIYDERPAKGFDVRAQAYLPNYPQLGGSLVFEQYFGKEVDLFGIENRQKDPYSLNVGVNYMPVPLVKTEVTHKMGKSGVSDTKVDLSLNLQLGTPLEAQLNPDNVAVARSLKGSRYDMVDRNYDIVFEYQKEDFSLELNGTTSAAIGERVTVNAIVNSRSPIETYEWFVEDKLGHRLNEYDVFIDNNAPSISFDMNSIKDLYVKVKVTTERGYSAISKAHIVAYKSSSTLSELDDAAAFVVDFNKLVSIYTPNFISELEALPIDYKAVSTFKAFDLNGDPFDVSEINSTLIKWRIKGEEEFITYDIENSEYSSVRFYVLPGDTNNQLKITAIGDEKLIETSGTRQIDVVVLSTINPEVSANATFTFKKVDDTLEELGIDLQNIKVQIMEIPEGQNAYSTYDDIVSESGIVNGKALATKTDKIKANTKYRAMIKTLRKEVGAENAEWVDVTEYFVKSMVWLYWDPFTGTEVTAVDNKAELMVNGELRKYRALEECRGSPIFFTQTNNYVFNELGWGEILDIFNQKSDEQKLVTEQGLRLAVQFDFTALNEANPEIPECISEAGNSRQSYISEKNYAGYIDSIPNQKITPKAVVWSSQ